MSRISTHVLDTVTGKPAAGVALRLAVKEQHEWITLGKDVTDADGRCRLSESVAAGTYRIVFETGPYLERNGRASIYPEITVIFICDGAGHYHLPLLLGGNSYTTYRGS